MSGGKLVANCGSGATGFTWGYGCVLPVACVVDELVMGVVLVVVGCELLVGAVPGDVLGKDVGQEEAGVVDGCKLLAAGKDCGSFLRGACAGFGLTST